MRITVPAAGIGQGLPRASLRGTVIRPLWSRPWDSPCVTREHNAARGKLREVLVELRRKRIIGPEVTGTHTDGAHALVNEWSGLPYMVMSLNDLSAEQLTATAAAIAAHYLESV